MLDEDDCDPVDQINIGGGVVDVPIIGGGEISTDPRCGPFVIVYADGVVCSGDRWGGKRKRGHTCVTIYGVA